MTISRLEPWLVRSLALLAASCGLSSAAVPENEIFIPTAVFLAGWPVTPLNPAQEVEALEALRYCDGLETDFVVLLDDGSLHLGYRPGRYDSYYPLGLGVAAVATYSLANGTDALLVVDGQGLVRRDWSPSPPNSYHADTVLAAGWTAVTGLWVHESAGVVIVFGFDENAEVMRRVQIVGSTVTALSDLLAPAGLLDFVPLEYDSQLAGVELAWLYDDTLKVTSGDQASLIENLPAQVDDRIARIPAAIGQTEDFLAWCSSWGGSQRFFTAWSENQTSVGVYPLQGGTPTDIIVYDRNDDGVADLAMPLLESSDVEVFDQYPLGTFAPPGGRPYLDTDGLDAIPAGPVSMACPMDVDQDGDLDLLVAHQGAAGLQFQLNAEVREDLQRLKLLDDHDISREFPVGEVTLHLPLFRNDQVSENYDVMVWVDRGGTEGWLDQPSFRETIFFDSSVSDPMPFSMNFSDEAINHQAQGITYWIFVAAVDLGGAGGQQIVKRHPTRFLSWNPFWNTSPVGPVPIPTWKYLDIHDEDDLTGQRRGGKGGNTGGGGPPP